MCRCSRCRYRHHVNALELPSGDGQIARPCCAACEDQGIGLASKLLGVLVHTNVRIRYELHAFRTHDVETTIHSALVELHVRDAVREQAADPVVALVDSHAVTGPVELLGGGEPRWAAANDRHLLAAPRRGRLGLNPAFLEALVDDRALDVLDGDSRLVDAEHASALTRSRTDAPGELGEVVRLVQAIERFTPTPVIDEVVPLGDQVVYRTASGRLAERNTAIHAARTLRSKVLLRHVDRELSPAGHSLQRVAVRDGFSWKLLETSWLTHCLTPPPEGPGVERHRARERPAKGHPSREARACSRWASPSRTSERRCPNPAANGQRRPSRCTRGALR